MMGGRCEPFPPAFRSATRPRSLRTVPKNESGAGAGLERKWPMAIGSCPTNACHASVGSDGICRARKIDLRRARQRVQRRLSGLMSCPARAGFAAIFCRCVAYRGTRAMGKNAGRSASGRRESSRRDRSTSSVASFVNCRMACVRALSKRAFANSSPACVCRSSRGQTVKGTSISARRSPALMWRARRNRPTARPTAPISVSMFSGGVDVSK